MFFFTYQTCVTKHDACNLSSESVTGRQHLILMCKNRLKFVHFMIRDSMEKMIREYISTDDVRKSLTMYGSNMIWESQEDG